MTRIIAVLALTISQFTAFPFVAIVAANTARQIEEGQAQKTDVSNVTVVYKTMDGKTFETL